MELILQFWKGVRPAFVCATSSRPPKKAQWVPDSKRSLGHSLQARLQP